MLNREERRLHHQLSNNNLLLNRVPNSKDGSDGDIAICTVGSQTFLYIKNRNRWHKFVPDNT